ncbi:MAG: acyltransferase family protein [Gaiellaceae bacterium]
MLNLRIGRQLRPRAGVDPQGAPAAGPGTPQTRLNGIEGLRGLAALGVLGWHVWVHPTNQTVNGVSLGPVTELFKNGRVGVTMFFVLSGFLLYRPFASAIIRGKPRPSVRKYFVNRILRIIPAYWGVLLLVAIFLQDELLERPKQLLANMFFLQNYVAAYRPDNAFHGLGIAPAWSLCVEVVFYIVLPLLSIGGFLLANGDLVDTTRAALAPAALLLVVGLASLGATRLVQFGPGWQFDFPIHADWFGVGMLVSILRVRWEMGALRPSAWLRRIAAAAAVVLALVAVKLAYGARITFDEEQTMLAIPCGLLLAIVVLPSPRPVLVRILQWRPLYAAGVVSYSLFLWHDPLLRELRNHGLTESGSLGAALALLEVLALTTILSTLTYRYIERPALALKQRVRTSGRPPDVEPAVDWSSAAP